MGGTVAVARVVYQVSHFSDRFPVQRTACGFLPDYINERGHPDRHPCPSFGQWRYVTCRACLATVQHDQRIRARIAALDAEEAERGL